MEYLASGMCEITFTYSDSKIGNQTYSATASAETYNVAIDTMIDNLNLLIDKYFLENPSYKLYNVIYTNIKTTLVDTSNPINSNLYIDYPITNYVNGNAPGVFISINFNNGNILQSPIFTNLVEAVNYVNYILDKLVINISKLVINTLTIFINPGDSYVTKINSYAQNNEFNASGVYNCCSDIPILDIYVGNEKVNINKFEIGGSGASNIYGSCKFIVYNLCALQPNDYDINRIIPILPKVVFQNFIWIGSLWVDFIYTNLTDDVYVNFNSDGMRTYKINGFPTDSSKVSESTLKKYPWLYENIADSFFMTNVTIQIPHSTNVPVNTNIYRIKPLFYFNSFKIIQSQINSCSIWSFAAQNATGNPSPLVRLSSGLNLLKKSTSEYLLVNSKISSELYGVYLPIALQIDNLQKVGILSSSFTGQIIIQSNSLAISTTYLLALGTINGQPLTENNPISKAIIFNCYNDTNGISTRPGGVVAPSRLVLNCNEFVCNAYKPITSDLYSTPTKATKYLPWTLENLENNPPPISKFSSSLFWNVSPNNQSSGVLISSYDAILLTNYQTVIVPL